MTDERRPIGHLHVDPDAQGVFVRGDAVYVTPVDENGEPAQVTGSGAPLGDGWSEVGFVDEAEHPFDRVDAPPPTLTEVDAPATTNWVTRSIHVEMSDIAQESLRSVLGFDPASDGSGEPVFATQATVVERLCPFTTPRKRRGLTGKRYRIARRQWARNVRAWRRGQVPDRVVMVHYFVPRARLIDRQIQRTLEGKIEGVRATFIIADEGLGDDSPWFAKPGYGGDHD